MRPRLKPEAGNLCGTAGKLLAWYDRERRHLPWRATLGVAADPYRVWLSEIMLQQTTVKAVMPRYALFLERWPHVMALAGAELGEVLAAWAGLGYYARARNLHACARAVVERHGGTFPADEAALRQLRGVGEYTAAAIAAIAFQIPATPVDGNIERVVARLFAVTTPLPQAKAEIRSLAATLTPDQRPGDYVQAMMDLGATICTPRRPACGLCPLRPDCRAYAEGITDLLPYRAEKGARPVRGGTAFVAVRADGAVLLRERPLKGLLGGMLEVPATPWADGDATGTNAGAYRPIAADWSATLGVVEHTFTHFHLVLAVQRADVGFDPMLDAAAAPERCRWLPRRDLAAAALPSVIKKILSHAFDADDRRTRVEASSPTAGAPRRAKRRSA